MLVPLVLSAALAEPARAAQAAAAAADAPRLPTGVRLDPAGETLDVGAMPLALALAPGGGQVVLLRNGWRERGPEVVDLSSGRVVQQLDQPAAFLGLAFAPDGRALYASGGDEDAVYRYAWSDGRARPDGRIVLAEKPPDKNGTRHPAGLAFSRDGRRLYVAENLADTLAVIDPVQGTVVQRVPTGPYPYAVVAAPDGSVYVSAWGGDGVDVFTPAPEGRLAPAGHVAAGRHPSALLLNHAGSRLFVASGGSDRVTVIDTAERRVLGTLADPPPAGGTRGTTPNALALSSDGRRLYVAEADANAVAVFELSAATAGVHGPAQPAADRLAGRIPAGWYPAALLLTERELLVANAKGRGTRPSPGMLQPGNKLEPGFAHYTLAQLSGTLGRVALGELARLDALTRRVTRANGWDRGREPHRYPPLRHVIYIIKENRTYDQVFGDLPQGDGDPALLFFPRAVSPNHHALAERFGLFDRFFTNAEVSAQGHIWTTAAYVPDYVEKTTPTAYAYKRPEGDRGDVDEPEAGHVWDAALRKGLDVRIYGEGAEPVPAEPAAPRRYRALRPRLEPYTSPDYPSYDLTIPDQARADVWLRDFEGYVKSGRMPAFQMMQLPGDHTSGARPGRRTPRAHMADNDLALARVVEAVSRSPFWRDTVIFSVEDDAQAGPDHVDSHRSVLLAISAWSRPGLVHRFVNTTDVVATILEILGLESLSHFDHHGRPLREIFSETPDLRPYTALMPEAALDERNPADGAAAAASLELELDVPDAAEDALFNRVLWVAIKGADAPPPPPARLSTLDFVRGGE